MRKKIAPVPPAGDARSAAALALAQVLGRGRALDDSLDAALSGIAERRERALAKALGYGVMRWLPRLEALLGQLLHRPLKAQDQDLRALLLIGLYQYLELRVPDYAATAATVQTVYALGKPWAAGLVNGVLRNFLRGREALLRGLESDPVARLAHPDWLLRHLREDWPAQWEDIAAANNLQPPMTLRVNARQGGRAEYLAELRAAGLDADPCAHAPQGLTLREAVDVESLPGFAEGRVSVQDQAAQLAAPLLDVPPGARVLDACAAPGGKTAHILECQPEAQVWAIDHSAARLPQLQATLQRLRLSAEVRCADAARPDDWWDGRGFARILLDAPCSGGGVIRRHPDIKYLRRADDLPRLAERQAALLEALWPLLVPGGMLVYATCSVFGMENHRQIQAFLVRHHDARTALPEVAWGRPLAAGRQILPGEEGMDGFYYVALRKA